MQRGAALGLGIIFGVAAAWICGLTLGPFESDSADMSTSELEAEVRRVKSENAALRRAAAERPLALEAQPGGPPPAASRDASPDATATRTTTKPPPTDMFRRWRASPTLPPDIPKALRGKPAMWIEAMRMADEAGRGNHVHFFMMALIAVGPDAVAPLKRVLLDPSERTGLRAHALTALHALAPGQIAELSAGLVENEPQGSPLRSQALQTLANARPTQVSKTVVDLAYDTNAPLGERKSAMTAVMHADPREAEAMFRHALRDGVDPGRETAYQVLQQALRPELRPYLEEVLEEAPKHKQSGLIQALARMKGPGWGDAQMTGPPDTPVGGDNQTAWASRQGEEGIVWVELDFPIEVTPEQLRVHETFNAGAIVKVEARAVGGGWMLLWSGAATPASTPRWFAPSLAETSDRTRTIRLTLDTDKVKGWNEIDAVELVGDGRRQWASSARSSSCYARRGR